MNLQKCILQPRIGGLKYRSAPSRRGDARFVSPKPRWRRLLFGEDGGPLVEMGFVMPMMMVLVTGMCAFGLSLNNYIELTSAVGNAGQYLQQTAQTTSDPCSDVATALKNIAPNLGSNSISISLTMSNSAGTSTKTDTGTANSFSCSGDKSFLSTGGNITVAASYPCTLAIYALPYGAKIGRSCTLSAQVTEYEY
jgi:Flp pilus assembly protein TadG